MAIEVKLPDLGDGIASGDVLGVLVREGDQIKKNQGILELETDKATVEVPSSHGGKVLKVHVSTGQSVPIGAILLTLEAEASAPKTSQPAAPAQLAAPTSQAPTSQTQPRKGETQQAQPAAAEKPAPAAKATQPVQQPSTEQVPATSAAPAKSAPATTPASEPEHQAETSDDNGMLAAGPAVRRFAREVGVDLRSVTGSGTGGRITRDDVLHVVRQTSQNARSGRAGAAAAKTHGDATTDSWGPVRYERLSKIRKTIATKMHESWSTVPRVTNFDDADVTELEKFRKSSKDDYATKGVKLTSMPFVIKSVAMALKAHPLINASIDLENDRVVYKDYVNIGVAVDTERGLVVPSLRGAGQLSIPEIAQELAALSERVRTNSFSIEDLRGGTFTISNLGAIGGTYSTPIINTPEVAILLVGRSRKLPVVIEDKIVPRLMMPLSLSYDHRLVDGATAARFLNEVIGYLQAPSRLLLAP